MTYTHGQGLHKHATAASRSQTFRTANVFYSEICLLWPVYQIAYYVFRCKLLFDICGSTGVRGVRFIGGFCIHNCCHNLRRCLRRSKIYKISVCVYITQRSTIIPNKGEQINKLVT